jgi:hypothetical protein
MADQEFVFDEESKQLTANSFQKEGYTFSGWKDGNDVVYTDEQSVRNLTATSG